MKAEIKMRAHIVCPNCGNGDNFSCDHVLLGESRQFGPWCCKQCGHAIRGQRAADGSIDIERVAGERLHKTVDLLVLKPQDKPVYFIVEGMRFEYAPSHPDHDPDRDENDSKQYLYEEHSCPTNWLKPEMVYHDGDSDPHGLIEFVATRDDRTFRLMKRTARTTATGHSSSSSKNTARPRQAVIPPFDLGHPAVGMVEHDPLDWMVNQPSLNAVECSSVKDAAKTLIATTHAM